MSSVAAGQEDASWQDSLVAAMPALMTLRQYVQPFTLGAAASWIARGQRSYSIGNGLVVLAG
jgi:hypothetical protein